nr:uncharacterized protein LOC117274341 [Nicotiana tomentosiformis]
MGRLAGSPPLTWAQFSSLLRAFCATHQQRGSEEDASLLFDTGSTYSYLLSYFASYLDMLRGFLDDPVHVATPVGDSIMTDQISPYHVILDCHAKTMALIVEKGCLAYLDSVRDFSVDTLIVDPVLERLHIAQSRKKSYTDRKARDVAFMDGEKEDSSHVLDFSSGNLDKDLTYDEDPVTILDRQARKLRSKNIASVKVQWRDQPFEEETWEDEHNMQSKYPYLF